MSRAWSLLLLVLLCACGRTRPPTAVAQEASLRIEIRDADTGAARLLIRGLSATDPLETLTRPFGLLLPAPVGSKPLYVEFRAERRGERLWVHTVVTRLDDDATLHAVFQLKMKERQLSLCALGPCPPGLTQTSVDAADAALPRVHSLASVPLSGPIEWRATAPDGGRLAIRAYLL
ncbi:MAG: hypothetical protein JNL79_21190 [Myxococcales bacterium]|nr:hypothetical protein [Myxococcales bacterium]